MERIKWVDERLQAWAAWAHGAGGSSGAGALFDPGRVDQTDDVRAGMRNMDPAFNSAALETDQAVARLPTELKRTVCRTYLDDGGMQLVADRLGITRATLHRRLCQADLRIAEWFDARRARAEELRQRFPVTI